MTACGVYPTPPFILKSVDAEVRAQVRRLRNHASIALWCGNNEDFMIADSRGVKYDITDLKGPWDKTEMPQRIIYMKIWPEIVKEMMPGTSYWPSSPFGGPSANDATIGDVHQWNGNMWFSFLGRACIS
jgi:beta-mannosidase